MSQSIKWNHLNGKRSNPRTIDRIYCIGDLFNDNRRGKSDISKNFEGSPILRKEVSNVIKQMKHNKAIGPDEISSDLIKSLDYLGVNKLTNILNETYESESGDLPEDLCRSIFIALPKNPGAIERELHRTISIMSHVTNILMKILMSRARNKISREISNTQCGFVRDKGAGNAIFMVRMLFERAVEMQQDLFLCFIDYSKAFDKVKHEELMRILEEIDIDGKDLRIVRNLYRDQYAQSELIMT